MHVGRDAELQVLDELLAEVCAGHGAMVFLSGEPGIGKTHLLDGLAARAEQRGCLVLDGSAAEFEQELPFGPVIDALDAYIQSLGPRIVERLEADGLPDLAEVFPSLRSLRSGSEGPPLSERFRSYHAVRDLLERLGAQQPFVLILDDLHWGDGSTLELVAHLLRRPAEGPVLVAGSFRSGQVDPRLSGAIEASLRSGSVRRLELGPLTAEQAAELVVGVDDAARERLYVHSGGNPFYLLEIARSGSGGQALARTEGVGAPPAVAAAIAGELAALTPAAQALARAASVVGDPFELDLAMATAGVGDETGLTAVDELVARELIRPSSVPRRFRFRHPLVRSAIYESATTSVRLASHARCAAALGEHGAPATTRAFHVEQSARHGDRAAIAVLIEAATGTARRLPSTSARWFEAAVRLLPATAPREERIELLTATASALAAAGRLLDARAVLLDGIGLVPERADQQRVRLTARCAAVEQRLGRHEEAHGRLVGALEQLTDRASSAAVELMVALATDGLYRREYESMQTWAAAAVAVAVDDRVLAATAEATLALASAFTGATEPAVEHCVAAARMIDAFDDDEVAERIDAIGHLAGAELYLDRYVETAAHAQRGITVARATGQDDVFPMLYPSLGTAAWVLGRLTESNEILDTAVEAARLTGNVQTVAWSLFNRSLSALMAGDLDTAKRTAEESVEIGAALGDSFVTSYSNQVLAWVLYEQGEPARAAALMVADGGGDDLPRVPGGWRTTHLEVLVRCWLAVGQLDRARAAAASAEAVGRQVGLPRSLAMALRAVAQVALAEGSGARAVDEARRSVAAADSSGAHLDAALSRVVLGRALAEDGHPDLAVAELEQAAADLDAYGAHRFRDAAEQELRKLGRRVHRRTTVGQAFASGIASLSGRELEVARLVVDRRTNPEIAADLFLSLKTVETHMRNIFRKLEVTSRVDVARAVERVARA
jgi:DNA-binding NarL/FixJ family response regulator/tetratricopeptide (TPR) repeat protein